MFWSNFCIFVFVYFVKFYNFLYIAFLLQKLWLRIFGQRLVSIHDEKDTIIILLEKMMSPGMKTLQLNFCNFSGFCKFTNKYANFIIQPTES